MGTPRLLVFACFAISFTFAAHGLATGYHAALNGSLAVLDVAFGLTFLYVTRRR